MYLAILMKWKRKLKTIHCKRFSRPVVPRGAGGAMTYQLTLFQPGEQIMPPHYYWQPRIFRPSSSLEMTLSHCIMAGRSRQERSIKLEITKKSTILFSFSRPLLCLLSLQPYFLDFFELLMFSSFVCAILIKQNNLNISSYFSENIK